MNIGQLQAALAKLPKDKLLYNSINIPTWHTASRGEIVLAGSPCPIQTVEHLQYRLKILLQRDYPSQDTTFRRQIDTSVELYQSGVREINGIDRLYAYPINEVTLLLWQQQTNDFMAVPVAIGGPSYILSSDQVKVLVNKPYFNVLGVNGKRHYLEELLAVHGFQYQNQDGEIIFVNKQYFDMARCGCDDEPVLNIANNIGGFDDVSLKEMPLFVKPKP